MHGLRCAILCGTVLFATGCASDNREVNELTARIDSIVQEKFEAGEFHGGLLVARGEQVLYRGAVGMADRARSIPNTPETLYPLQSITKSFTAIIILQLVEEGLLDLSGTLDQYFPDYGGPEADRITLHHLLSHTSGVPDRLVSIPGYWEELPDFSRDSLFSLIAAMPLEFEPGSAFAYTNTGFVLLATIAEGLTGQSYAELLQERIFDPLEMRDSRWIGSEVGEGIAIQYSGESAVPQETIYEGEAGIVSTLDDMHRFALALGSTELLSAEMWDLAFAAHALPEDAARFHPAHANPYGYGFGIGKVGDTDPPTRVVMHGGAGLGGTSMMQRVIDGEGMLLLWNNVAGPRPFLPEVLEVLVNGGGGE